MQFLHTYNAHLPHTPILTHIICTPKSISAYKVHQIETNCAIDMHFHEMGFMNYLSEHLWLAVAFISSTESCVIGYNVQPCKNVKIISGSVPASERRFEFSSCIFVLLKLHSKSAQKIWGGRMPPHFQWAWRLWWLLSAVWLPILFKISFFVSDRRKKLIEVWNNLRVTKYDNFHVWVNYV